MPFKSLICLLGAAAIGFAGVARAELGGPGSGFTPFGSEKAANPEGSIPEYTGGLPASTRPAGYKKDSGRWADPFPEERPLYSISRQNLAKYADRLSETAKALFQRYPNYRMDIYPSHRTVAYPAWVLDNIEKNAASARLEKGGLDVVGAWGGIPFPLVRNGSEVMWNHLSRYNSYATEMIFRNWFVSSNGRPVNSGELHISIQNPFYARNGSAAEWQKEGKTILQYAYNYTGPSQVVGNANMYVDTLSPVDRPRRAWAYSAASRRIRIAPDIAYDTPVASAGGGLLYDELYVLQGAPDLFDFRLLGKREMYLPYNNYRLMFDIAGPTLMTPQFINPDVVRWELHRVWVVEATLKPGKRHLLQRRTYYIDEDWGGAGMSDGYDAAGKLVRGMFQGFVQLYDVQTPMASTFWGYDLNSGLYASVVHLGDPGLGLWIRPEGFSRFTFTPDALPVRSGIGPAR